MTDATSGFDPATAEPFESRVGRSPHHAYRDANGNICLVCVSTSDGGGVAVNQSGRDWLEEREDVGRFVRLINQRSAFDKTVSLEELPKKPTRDGHYGPYAFYDQEDLGTPPPFPPRADDRPF